MHFFDKTLYKKILNAGPCLLVFSLPWQTRLILKQGVINGNPSELLTASFYGVDILVALIFLVAMIYRCRNFQFTPQRDKLEAKIFNFQSILKLKFFNFQTAVLLFFVFIAWNILSLLWAENRFLSAQRVGWILLAFLLAWLVAEYKNKAEIIFWFVMGLTLSAWLGIWQFATQNSFANKWLGLAEHNPANGGVSIVELYNSSGQAVRWLRAYGSFDHPNMFGGAMAVGIIFVMWLLNEKIKDDMQNAFLYLALASMSAGLFVSLSRSAWAGLLLALATVFLFVIFKKQKAILRNVAKSGGLIILVFILFALIYPNQFLMRSGGQGRLEQKSLDDRGAYLQQGQEIIKENLFLGVGAGNYAEALLNKNPKNDAWAYQPVHNVFLYVWAELGIIGLLLVVTIFFYLGIISWRKDIYFLAILLALVPSLLLDHWLWDLHFGVLLAGFMFGIIINRESFKKPILQ